MNIVVLSSSRDHPIYPLLEQWVERCQRSGHCGALATRVADLPAHGDVLFLVSCSEIVRPEVAARYRKALVLHASDLPEGRGWSPHIWEVLRGAHTLTVTLLEAARSVDSGDIWRKETIELDGTELYDEINSKLFSAELRLMDFAVDNFNDVVPQPQPLGVEVEYYPKRSPSDSRIDSGLSIASQFDLLRVSDPKRFPAFFEFRGAKYRVRLEKMDGENV